VSWKYYIVRQRRRVYNVLEYLRLLLVYDAEVAYRYSSTQLYVSPRVGLGRVEEPGCVLLCYGLSLGISAHL